MNESTRFMANINFIIIRGLIFSIFFSIDQLSVESKSSLAMNECDIFCHGNILHHIQMAGIYNDSKYFVDMKMKLKAPQIENSFQILMNRTNKKPNKSELKVFIKNNFEKPVAGLMKWIPTDWKDEPTFAEDIYDRHLKRWMFDINKIWKKLGRKLSEDVKLNNDLYSHIYVPHPFIIPGGRFKEIYYWDSYWIIEGLLLSEMYETAEKMILNFLFMVDQFDYVPNGNRKYYLGRSQPPLLIPMCYLYWKATRNVTFLENNINLLEKEFNFWMKHRSLMLNNNGVQYRVFQYKTSRDANSSLVGPRPESYYEDSIIAQGLNKTEKFKFYSAIKSAAESGWDFSSRWFDGIKSKSPDLLNIDTEAVVPVCLNSIMGYNANILSSFYLTLNNVLKSQQYKNLAFNMNKTMSRLFWNDDLGTWLDYNIKTNSSNPSFYLSNLMPLWTESYGIERDKSYIINRVLNYIANENINSYPGGIPTSLFNSSQQWDFPNAWPPLQYFLVLGLEKAKPIDIRAGNLALNISKKWIMNCYSSYKNFHMFEKYDVTEIGVPGSGGEYDTQEGFGWTIGVAMKIMSVYRHEIRTNYDYDPIPLIIGLILIICSTVTIVLYILGRNKRASLNKKLLKNNNKPHTNIAFHNIEEDFV